MDQVYCGPAPMPAELLGRWNLDPVLIAALAVLAGLHVAALWRAGRAERRSAQPLAAAAWFLLAALFVSPLCALTSALFSARVAHHMLMVAVAAPLLVLALPRPMRAARFPGAAALLHTVVLWFWHAPASYAAALASHGTFWLMELTLMASALWLWLAILSPRAAFGPAMAALLGSVIQTGLLGAVITFARAPLYAPHFGVTEPWGLSALADQQLAGLIMWVPAAAPYLVAAFVLFGHRLARLEARGRMP